MEKAPENKDSEGEIQNQLNPVEAEMISDIENLDIPREKKIRLIQQTVSISSSFSGPLPPPEMLIKYNKAVNNGAERIFIMAESQLKHNHEMEKKKFRLGGIGQIMGFALAVSCIAGTIYLAMNDHAAVAIALGTSTVIGLVTVFVLGKGMQEQKD